jgi:superfamily II DNA or RNA helicase
MTSTVQTKIMRRSKAPDEYAIYRAGLEWDLIDPIVIEGRDDLKSEDRWKRHVEPYHHQVTNLITFCRRLPVTLLADDVGLGKTISAGLVVSELAARGRVQKVLVVGPKLLGPQWKEELETKFRLPAEVVIGKDLLRADPKEGGAIITTYNSARLYLDKLPQDRFQMLILDEAHKLRNLYGVEKPPQVAVTFRRALEQRRFRYVLMLTATPIQNRLWDLYSLVDLLSVARGHQNPFGSVGMFARKFIADDREKARQLKIEARDEFRSIVYGYMSRVRRGDSKLIFPDRVVQMHRIRPSPGELELIAAIAKPIQSLSILVQISILQALASSPEALAAQLNNMARKGSVPAELAAKVRTIVGTMPMAAKLKGLGALVDQLRTKNPERWRAIIFTRRLETQTTIEAFLSSQGIKVGIINGTTGGRNQDTIARLRSDPPTLNVIVSTEAGSEGVNLQAANVVVNYDLPWNPMVVEQRIGRVQRLASAHASVIIFNVVLAGTFEEYIVGRLMEKLQMASHAIGDIESLLEASGVGGDEDEASFEDMVRQLVVASLAGKDVAADLLQQEQSIEEAKIELERERKNIDSMLGDMQGAEHVGPRAPSLPAQQRSMNPRDFVLAAFGTLGGKVSEEEPDGRCVIDIGGAREHLLFDRNATSAQRGSLYAPGSPHFSRLVDRVIATGLHEVEDADETPELAANKAVGTWVASFGGTSPSFRVDAIDRLFGGSALVRVRATVQHDSYERLVKVDIPRSQRGVRQINARDGLNPLPLTLQTAEECGVDVEAIVASAERDEGIAEFSRFYLERREAEVKAAGDDLRKANKLADEFTPRLAMTIVGLRGKVQRNVGGLAGYRIDGQHEYTSALTIDLQRGAIVGGPTMKVCAKTGRRVPADCLALCAISGWEALRHLLIRSEVSGRLALPEYGSRCSYSGKLTLTDEGERSAITHAFVARDSLQTSPISGRRAEPIHFARCAFTNELVLKDELVKSEFSGKLFRSDQSEVSSFSSKTGHQSEFEICYETRRPIARAEAGVCEVTGQHVRPDVLLQCSVTLKKVLPSHLATCAATGARALKQLLITSSVSGRLVLEQVAVRSAAGSACLPEEAIMCSWTGKTSHPDDIRVCELTSLPIHSSVISPYRTALRPLLELLEGVRHNAESKNEWEAIAGRFSLALRGAKCRVEAAMSAPVGDVLAIRCEVRSMFGLRVNHSGGLYSLKEGTLVGRVALGKTTARGWAA